MSIGNQRALLAEYVQKQGWEVVDTYIDDGFSGTNFDRPGFQRMIADIEKGRINLVITKDLSRLGRNYIMCGQYTEIYFPERHVRYIALNDGVDTLHHAPHIDFVFQHKLHISPRPEVAAFKLAIPFRVVLAETCVFLGG